MAAAEAWVLSYGGELALHEAQFLDACREAQAAVERERRPNWRIRALAVRFPSHRSVLSP